MSILIVMTIHTIHIVGCGAAQQPTLDLSVSDQLEAVASAVRELAYFFSVQLHRYIALYVVT